VSYAITTTSLSLANWITAIAWAEKGIQPRVVGDGGFKFAKIGSGGSFFNWGLIELGPDEMKRTKNSRYMHMVFIVQSGTVEVRVHENEFTVHKQSIWQVPRGMSNIPFIPLTLSHVVSIRAPRTCQAVIFHYRFPRLHRLCTTTIDYAVDARRDSACYHNIRVVRSAPLHCLGASDNGEARVSELTRSEPLSSPAY